MRGYFNLLRSAVLWLLFFLFALLLTIVYPLLFYSKKKEQIYQKAMQIGYRIILFFSGVRVKVEGKENIPQKRGFIVAANHTSFIDNMVMSAVFPFPLRFVAASAGFSLPLIGTVVRGAGYLKASPRMKFDEIAALYRALKRGENVLIFSDVLTGEFTPAMYEFAKQAEVSVLPVRLEDSSKVLPMGKFILQDGEIMVTIGKLKWVV